MQKFLDTTNRKTCIFRDIIIESEYDPFEPNRRSIKAHTGRLKDPVKMLLQKRQDELGTLATTAADEAVGREILDVTQWATGKIEATPHGMFSKMMDSTCPKQTQTYKSNVIFDHYSIPRGREVLDKEFPRGKRIVCKDPVCGPSRDSERLEYSGAD
jgi:hypothetical protein